MKTRNQKGLESKYWLLIIVAACILCMAATFFAGVKSGPVRVIADYTVVPMQKGINVIGTWVNGVADNFVTLKSVQKENKTLKEQNANLKITSFSKRQSSWSVFMIYIRWIRIPRITRKWVRVSLQMTGVIGLRPLRSTKEVRMVSGRI